MRSTRRRARGRRRDRHRQHDRRRRARQRLHRRARRKRRAVAGPGVDDATLARKIDVVRERSQRHAPAAADPIGALRRWGASRSRRWPASCSVRRRCASPSCSTASSPAPRRSSPQAIDPVASGYLARVTREPRAGRAAGARAPRHEAAARPRACASARERARSSRSTRRRGGAAPGRDGDIRDGRRRAPTVNACSAPARAALRVPHAHPGRRLPVHVTTSGAGPPRSSPSWACGGRRPRGDRSALQPLGALAAAACALGVSLLATGAFHEDGLADTSDALGGGFDREKILLILKDSRVGAFGAAALVRLNRRAHCADRAPRAGAALRAIPLVGAARARPGLADRRAALRQLGRVAEPRCGEGRDGAGGFATAWASSSARRSLVGLRRMTLARVAAALRARWRRDAGHRRGATPGGSAASRATSSARPSSSASWRATACWPGAMTP